VWKVNQPLLLIYRQDAPNTYADIEITQSEAILRPVASESQQCDEINSPTPIFSPNTDL